MYKVIFSADAQKGLLKLSKKAPVAMKKLAILIDELREHPKTGTGQIELLRYQEGREIWSRRINREHRLVYSVEDDVVEVFVISVYGHYDK